MKLLRNIWMVTHMLMCVGAVMLGYDRSIPWWQVLLLVAMAYFANDIVLSLAGLCLGRHRLSRLARDVHIPTIQSY
jgi:membrane protein DedA with SNARE-associated domain